MFFMIFFFFQAEDGIRDADVTGVQTCALPILVRSAAGALGRSCRTRATGGASDANVWASRGLEIANLGCGMREIHTVNEWVDLKDVVVTAELVLEAVRLNAA